jgi:hypothetical protein
MSSNHQTFSQDDPSLLPRPEGINQFQKNQMDLQYQAFEKSHPTTNVPILNSETHVSSEGNLVIKFSR